MKKLMIAALLLLTSTVHAQFEGMTAEDMTRMMGAAGELIACLGQLDEKRLEQLGQRAQAANEELEQLCAAGNRDEAQAKAVSYAQELMAEPEYQQLMQCGERAQSMVPGLMDLADLDLEDESQHVCDAL